MCPTLQSYLKANTYLDRGTVSIGEALQSLEETKGNPDADQNCVELAELVVRFELTGDGTYLERKLEQKIEADPSYEGSGEQLLFNQLYVAIMNL